MSQTLFVTHDDCLLHNMGSEHAESPRRLAGIIAQLESSGLMAQMERIQAPSMIREEAIFRAHDPELWRSIIQASPSKGFSSLSREAIMSPGTLKAIRRAVGGAVEAVERVADGRNQNAFVATRPPGHHATREAAMGFCFVNNAAVAALHALDALGLSRVAIVDIDVHHGNGTEDIVAGDPRIFMASTFGSGIYPGHGEHALGDNMANIPLPNRTPSAAMRAIALQKVIPSLDQFKPELVIVSAGYDAHKSDPLGNQRWEDEDYHWWFEQLMGVASRHAGGRLVALLEGGYNVEALARCVEQSVLALLGRPSGESSATAS